MRSKVENLLTITEFAEIIGLHRWYTAQWGYQNTTGTRFPDRRPQVNVNGCEYILYEYHEQDGKLSRYEISRAINEAEYRYALQVGYWPAPKYFVNEEHQYPGNSDRSKPQGGMYNVRGELKQIALDWDYLQAVGTKEMTLIDANAAIVQNCATCSAVFREFEVVVTVPAGTLASEIAVFYTEADRQYEPLEEWQIRPLRISVVGTTATIRGNSFLLANPVETLEHAPQPLVVEEPTHYVTEVEVWRVTTDANDTGSFYWNENCSAEVDLACYGIGSGRDSYVIPQRVVLDGDVRVPVSEGCRIVCGGTQGPKNVYVNYLAGYPRQTNGRMDYHKAQHISWLTAAYVACKPCGCGCGKNGEKQDLLSWWSSIPAIGEEMDRLAVTHEDLNNPFGPKRGAIKVWRDVKEIRKFKGKAI